MKTLYISLLQYRQIESFYKQTKVNQLTNDKMTNVRIEKLRVNTAATNLNSTIVFSHVFKSVKMLLSDLQRRNRNIPNSKILLSTLSYCHTRNPLFNLQLKGLRSQKMWEEWFRPKMCRFIVQTRAA
jgi:hypothetical protein